MKIEKNRVVFVNRFLMAGVAAVALSGAAFAQDADTSATNQGVTRSASAIGLDEIVVTAERREGNLQRVPVAVSAFNADELVQRQVTNLVDVVKDVPNLIGHNNVGLSTATTVYLRGIGSTQSFATVDTTIGFYVDDVYIARQNANNFALFDVERLEVLRGPQGTLYGRNTSGGAIKVVMKKPQPEVAASIEGNIGNYETYGAKASVNLPVADGLYVRFNAATQQQGRGFARNVTTGRRDNDRSVDALRAALRWEPSDIVEVNLSADYVSDYSNGVVPVDVRGAARPATDSLFETSSGGKSFNDVESWGVTGNIRIETGLGAITSITAYRKLDQLYSLDLSDQPVPLYILDNDSVHEQFSQELQITGEAFDDRLDWIAGGFFMKEWNTSGIGDTYAARLADGTLVPSPGRLDKVVDNDVRSFAFFGQATFEIVPDLKITGGLRYTDDWKDVSVLQRDAAGNVSYDTDTLIGLGIPTELRYKKWSPKLGISWQAAPNILAFASYTKGFKSGGWNSRVINPAQFYAIAPEYVTAYEAGVKTELFDRRLRLNVTGFLNEIQDLVIGTIGTSQAFETLNTDAKTWGVEVESRVQVTRGLQLFANVGLMDAKYVDLGDDPLGFSGRKLPRVSDVTAKVGGSYDMDVSWGVVSLNADYSHTSPYFASANNSPISRVPNIGLFNARISTELNDGALLISAGCKNCFDKEYFHSMLDFAAWQGGRGFSAAYAGDPRTYNVTLRANF